MSIKITATFTVPDDSGELATALAKFGATTNDGETSRTVDQNYLTRNVGQPLVVEFTCSFGIEARRHVEYLRGVLKNQGQEPSIAVDRQNPDDAVVSPSIDPCHGATIVDRLPREALLDAVRRNMSVLKDIPLVIHDEHHVAKPINEPSRAPKP